MADHPLWKETLDQLEKSLSPQHFSTWIRPIRFLGIEHDQIRLAVPNRFIQSWVKDNFSSLIRTTISEIGAVSYQLKIVISQDEPEEPLDIVSEVPQPAKTEAVFQTQPERKINGFNLNPKYTFNEFVSGSSNQFAYAASLAVANNPAITYNPLFIYGGVGLGKTHLVNAIGNSISEKNPQFRVCYYSTEKFTNELINSLRYNKMDEFRDKFRSMDVLLIDDVQFLAGKERTQEVFFHTFNALYEAQKQIVVTSDKFPKEIPDLEERLRSRFEWGLIADIQPPDVETKLAILKVKAELNGINLPEDVALFLANSVTSNVRELEGYLVRIGAFASLTSTPVTLQMAKDILKNILIDKRRQVTIEEIQKTTAHYYNIKISDLKSAKRLKALVLPRQVAMYLSRQLTAASYPEIGEKFGGKDHSTIIHAIRKIERVMDEDMQIRTSIEELRVTLEH